MDKETNTDKTQLNRSRVFYTDVTTLKNDAEQQRQALGNTISAIATMIETKKKPHIATLSGLGVSLMTSISALSSHSAEERLMILSYLISTKANDEEDRKDRVASSIVSRAGSLDKNKNGEVDLDEIIDIISAAGDDYRLSMSNQTSLFGKIKDYSWLIFGIGRFAISIIKLFKK